MKTLFEVHPQRKDDRVYETCELHRATSFAVVKIESYIKNKRRYIVKRIIARYARMSEAELHAETARKRLLPFGPVYKLGRRMAPR